jgi:putative ABC transport system permease protein
VLTDLRHAARRLLKSPGYASVSVLTLALAVGVNAAVFAVVNALLLTPPRFAKPDRLAYVYTEWGKGQKNEFWGHSSGEAYDIRHRNSVFTKVAIFQWDGAGRGSRPVYAPAGAAPERLTGMSVSEDFFPLLEVPAAMGRWFNPEENAGGGAAIVSNRFWRSRLGSDPSIVGKSIPIDGGLLRVVGVMPPSMDDPLNWGRVDIWRPLALEPGAWSTHGGAWLKVLGRLKAGVTMAQAQADMDSVALGLARDFPDSNADTSFKVYPLELSRIDAAVRRISWLTMGLTAFVLLIACVNLASLQLARAASRSREFAIRLAMGSSRAGLVRGLMAEPALLAAAGGLAGILLADWATKAVGASMVVGGAAGLDLPVNFRVAAVTFLSAAATSILFGLAPAWAASRTDTITVLKSGGRGMTSDRGSNRFRRVLVVTEIALSLVLLAGAGFYIRGAVRLANRDLGWNPGRLVIGTVDTGDAPDSKLAALADQVRARLEAVPGVAAVSFSVGHPASGYAFGTDFDVDGVEASSGTSPIGAYEAVDPSFFSTLGIRVLQGRTFTGDDKPGSPAVVVVGKALADHYWPGGGAVGRTIGTGGKPRQWARIVGVVDDIVIPSEIFQQDNDLSALNRRKVFQIYIPLSPPRGYSFTVRASGDPRAMAAELQRAVDGAAPEVSAFGVMTASQRVRDTLQNLELVGRVLAAMAGLGLMLAALGVYGVLANLTLQRAQEIGIRTALGAQRADIVAMVVRSGVGLALAGSAIGLGLALPLSRLLSRQMPEIPGRDDWMTASMALVMAAVCLAACWLPARWASRLDPVTALRSE